MTRLALINPNTNIVENVTLDDRPMFEIDIPGYIIVDIDEVGGGGIGDTWNGTVLVKPAPPPPPIPKIVTPRQARLALHANGLLTTVEAMIAASSKEVQLTWEYAIEFKRDDALINSLGGQLGLTETQIDDLFLLASTL
jgi:hypothetical protein